MRDALAHFRQAGPMGLFGLLLLAAVTFSGGVCEAARAEGAPTGELAAGAEEPQRDSPVLGLPVELPELAVATADTPSDPTSGSAPAPVQALGLMVASRLPFPGRACRYARRVSCRKDAVRGPPSA